MALLSGCAYLNNQTSYTDIRDAQRPLICESKEQCDRYWQRAEVFVSNYAGFKIQTLSDNTI